MPTAYDLRTRADDLVAVASELDPEQFDTELARLLDDCDDKAGAYRAVYYALRDREAAMKAERERFAAAEKRAAADTERVKHGLGELLAAREAVGEPPKIVGAWGSAWLQVNGQPSIDVIEEAAIPAAYKVQPPPPPPVLSRELVLAAWRDGTDVPGVVVTLGRHVRVK